MNSYLDIPEDVFTPLTNSVLHQDISNFTRFLQMLSAVKKTPASEIYSPHLSVMLIISILYGFITLLAIAGNSIVIIIIFSSRGMHTVTNYLIANLAVADLIIGIFAIPIHFQAALLRNWYLPEFMCPIFPFAEDLSVNVSIFTLSAIALDRHRAIMYPFKPKLSKKTTLILIIVVWLVGIGFSIPYVLGYGMATLENTSKNETRLFCANYKLSPEFWKVYLNVSVANQYCIPAILLCAVYIRLVKKLWKITVPGNPQHVRDHIMETNRRKVSLIFILFTNINLF